MKRVIHLVLGQGIILLVVLTGILGVRSETLKSVVVNATSPPRELYIQRNSIVYFAGKLEGNDDATITVRNGRETYSSGTFVKKWSFEWECRNSSGSSFSVSIIRTIPGKGVELLMKIDV